MGKRTTVYEVAEKAGVSIATVSFAFRQPQRVREETRVRVLRTAQELGYVPSASARGLARGSTGALGLFSFDLILPSGGSSSESGMSMPLEASTALGGGLSDVSGAEAYLPVDPGTYPLYVDEVQRGFELECWENDMTLLVSSGTGREATRVTELAGRVDGLAIFPGPFPDASLALLARRLPVVVFARSPIDAPVYRVGVDNEAGMVAVVDHLHQVHGATRMEFVGATHISDLRTRFQGFQRRLGELGLLIPSAPIDEVNLDESESLETLRARLSYGVPDALVCGTDQIALRVLALVTSLGLRVPEDVKVTGFDGILAGRLTAPTLTTVHQPMEAMGRFAAHVLSENATQPWTSGHTKTFPVRLIARGSCGCR